MQSSFVNNRGNQDGLLSEADRFDTCKERISNIDALRQGSNDNTETLLANSKTEITSLEQTRDNLLERLANATAQNPARVEEYEA